VKKIKKFTPRTLREIHATGLYVASVAPSLRALRENKYSCFTGYL